MTTPPPSDSPAHPSPAGPQTQQTPRTAVVSLLLLLCLGAVAIILIGIPSDLFDLDRHAVPKETVLHGTALLSGGYLVFRWTRWTPGLVDLLLLFFVGWSALATLGATNHWIAFRAFGITASAGMIYCAGRRLRRDGLGGPLAACLAAAIVLGACTGLAQAYGREIGVLAESRAPGGTLGNRNSLAHLVAIGLPLLVIGTMTSRRWLRVGAWMGLVLAVQTLVLTRSRAAWLAALASLLLLLITLRLMPHAGRPRLRRVVLPLGAFGLGALLAVVLPNTLEWKSDSPYLDSLRSVMNYQEGSGRGRLIQYRNSLRMVPHDPVLGVGPGNWMVHYPRVTSPGDPSFAGADPIPTNPWPSSDWVGILTERGAVALLLLGLAALGILTTALRRAATGEDPLSAAALAGVTAAIAVVGTFDAVLVLPAPAFLASGMVGALLPDSRPVVARDIAPPRLRLLRLVVLAVLAAATLRSGLLWAAIAAAGDGRTTRGAVAALRYDPWNYRLEMFLAGRGSCRDRLPHAAAAARLLPWHPYPARVRERCGDT